LLFAVNAIAIRLSFSTHVCALALRLCTRFWIEDALTAFVFWRSCMAKTI